MATMISRRTLSVGGASALPGVEGRASSPSISTAGATARAGVRSTADHRVLIGLLCRAPDFPVVKQLIVRAGDDLEPLARLFRPAMAVWVELLGSLPVCLMQLLVGAPRLEVQLGVPTPRLLRLRHPAAAGYTRYSMLPRRAR